VGIVKKIEVYYVFVILPSRLRVSEGDYDGFTNAVVYF
jgi:hypothetical protein